MKGQLIDGAFIWNANFAKKLRILLMIFVANSTTEYIGIPYNAISDKNAKTMNTGESAVMSKIDVGFTPL